MHSNSPRRVHPYSHVRPPPVSLLLALLAQSMLSIHMSIGWTCPADKQPHHEHAAPHHYPSYFMLMSPRLEDPQIRPIGGMKLASLPRTDLYDT